LADQRGSLQVVAASSETSRVLELLQLQHDQGRAWTATAPVSRSRSPMSTWPQTDGRSSWPKPAPRVTVRSMRCRCACVTM
jgi:hypothetical protein